MKKTLHRATPILIVTYAMAGLGAFSASLVSELGPAFVVISLAALALSALFSALKKEILIPHRAWTLFAILLFAYFLVDYLVLSEGLIGSAARFLTVLAAAKLFDLNTDRDYMTLYGLVFFQILAAAASTVSPVFFAIISTFIISAIWAMILFNIKGEYLAEHPDAENLPGGIFGMRFFAFTVGLSVSSIIITLALFFTIPRVGIGLLPKKTLDTVKVSGFSERVELGAIGPVKNDPTIVMRVTLPDANPPQAPLYFRGQSLDAYDGTAWSRAERPKRPVEARGQGLFTVRGYEKDMLEQRIMLEPLDTDVLFAADRPHGVMGTFARLWTDGAGSIHLYSPPYSRIEYTAFSTIAQGGLADSSEPIEANLDASIASEKVRTLVAGITANTASDSQKAEAISEYLRTNYRYTLSPASNAAVPPLDDFLFNSKEGYCEHYATALAVMLRVAGVPTRIATGFVRGEWNSYGKYYVVRQQDAHTWVEARMDGKWASLDPTPQIGLTGVESSSEISLFFDSLRYKWMRYIVRYTLSDQMKAASTVEGGLTSFIRKLGDELGFLTGGKGPRRARAGEFDFGPAMAAVVLIALLAVLYMTRKKQAAGARELPDYYLEMTAILKKKGFLRGDSETPLEFAGRVGIKDVALITDAYNAERFGKIRPSAVELDRISASLARIATITRLKEKGKSL
jgi:transglutaminase-like putative cysteine protease